MANRLGENMEIVVTKISSGPNLRTIYAVGGQGARDGAAMRVSRVNFTDVPREGTRCFIHSFVCGTRVAFWATFSGAQDPDLWDFTNVQPAQLTASARRINTHLRKEVKE